MNKESFLGALRERISYLPKDDVDERILFYEEMIEDRIEEGMTEEEAIASIGTVEEIANRIMSEIPLTKVVKEKVKPGRSLKAWEVVLLLIFLPVWLPLVIVFFSVVFSIYMVIWSLVICVFAIDLALAACALASIPLMVYLFATGDPAKAILSLGAGLVFAGLAIAMFIFSKWITKGIIKITGKFILGIKSLFTGRKTDR